MLVESIVTLVNGDASAVVFMKTGLLKKNKPAPRPDCYNTKAYIIWEYFICGVFISMMKKTRFPVVEHPSPEGKTRKTKMNPRMVISQSRRRSHIEFLRNSSIFSLR